MKYCLFDELKTAKNKPQTFFIHEEKVSKNIFFEVPTLKEKHFSLSFKMQNECPFRDLYQVKGERSITSLNS